MKWLRLLGGWHFIAATAINPPKQRVSLQLMTSCCMNIAVIIQWIYFTIWKKIRKNHHHYNTILSLYNIISRHYKKSNIPWIWRIIYEHKLPYMKKTIKKKQVCGAACFMEAEIKFSKDVHPSVRKGFWAFAGESMKGMAWNFTCWCIVTIFIIDKSMAMVCWFF